MQIEIIRCYFCICALSNLISSAACSVLWSGRMEKFSWQCQSGFALTDLSQLELRVTVVIVSCSVPSSLCLDANDRMCEVSFIRSIEVLDKLKACASDGSGKLSLCISLLELIRFILGEHELTKLNH